MMRQRYFKFLVVLILLFYIPARGQEKFPHFSSAFANTSKQDSLSNHLNITAKANGSFHPGLHFTGSLSPLPKSFYTRQLGFFCKKEIEVEKFLAIPLRFRLGSMDYVNYLEGKPNAGKSH